MLSLAVVSLFAAFAVFQPVAHAFVSQQNSWTSSSTVVAFASRRHIASQVMDEAALKAAQLELEKRLYKTTNIETSSVDEFVAPSTKKLHVQQRHLSVEQAEAVHGMPWKTSICEQAKLCVDSNGDSSLLYMPFWTWQMQHMRDNLTDLRVESCTNSDGTDFTFNQNERKKARIVNLCFSSKEYRKIRMTYYDAGDNTQVFNSVWYPDPSLDLPVLGIDLLAFNRKKYLAIVDFQPLHDAQAASFEHLLAPIKSKYDSLKGKMSAKFYDETQFFSQQMLFSRFEDESIIQNELFPAFTEYVQTHVDMCKSDAFKSKNAAKMMQYQQAYDNYSAERDPATGLFVSMFGNQWAVDFVHDFLFSLSDNKPTNGQPHAPVQMGAPPRPATAAVPPASSNIRNPVPLQPAFVQR